MNLICACVYCIFLYGVLISIKLKYQLEQCTCNFLSRVYRAMRSSVAAALVCLLCLRAVATNMSATFKTVEVAGKTQCSMDTPLFASQGSASPAECASQCEVMLSSNCEGFNYREDTHICEMFNEATTNYLAVPGCTLYQVG